MDISDIRPVPPHLHPVSLQRYLIPTDSISETYSRVHKTIRRRDSGLMIYGYSRYGKTCAMMYCQRCLNAEFPTLPVAIFNAKDEISAQKGGFYSTFLEVVKCKELETRISTADKHSRLVNFMCGEAEKDPLCLYIVFIDEAQRLMLSHYQWIKDIYNDLNLRGITLLPILVGQKELLTQKGSFEKTGKDAIVDRFMLYEHAFRGIREKEDFIACLGHYDSSVYPANTNWTYTRFFLPKAFSNGFRLANIGDALWDAFNESYASFGFRSRMEIPMKYFTRTVELLLTDYSEQDSADFLVTPDLLKDIIRESWYLAATSSRKKMNPGM